MFFSLVQATVFSLSFPYFSFGGYGGVFQSVSVFSLANGTCLHRVVQGMCAVTRRDSTCKFSSVLCPAVLDWGCDSSDAGVLESCVTAALGFTRGEVHLKCILG